MSRLQPNSQCGRIRAAVASFPVHPTTQDVANVTGLPRSVVGKALSKMRQLGFVRQVRKAGKGRFGRPATWAVSEEVNP